MRTQFLKFSFLMSPVLGLLMVAAIAQAAPSEQGTEGIGGGQWVVDADGERHLLDIVSAAVCEWKSGFDVVNENPGYREQVIETIKKMDWYFASDFLRETENLNFCFTEGVFEVSSADRDIPVEGPKRQLPHSSVIKQAAFRIGSNVYVNAKEFRSASKEDRSFLLAHETTHSFILSWENGRQMKVRSFVKAIRSFYLGLTSSSIEALHEQMAMSGVKFPFTVQNLSGWRTSLEFLLADPRERVNQLQNVDNINVISDFDVNSPVVLNLAESDQQRISSVNPKRVVEGTFLSLLLKSSMATFRKVLNDIKYESLNPILAVLNEYDQLQSDKQKYVLSLLDDSLFFQRFFGGVLAPEISTGADGRIYVDGETASELGATRQPTALFDLQLSSGLPGAYRALALILIKNVHQGDWDYIVKNCARDSSVAQVLSLDSLKKGVADTDTKLSVEKVWGYSQVENLQRNIRSEFDKILIENLDRHEQQKLFEILNKIK